MNTVKPNWFQNISITTKLYFLMGIMAFLIVAELIILHLATHALSSTRGFVTGEGLYSKAQKDAVYSLRKYGTTLNEEDYRNFRRFIKVNIGDKKARLELEKENYNKEIVIEGLREGRNNPDDIEDMIKLFKWFRHVGYIDKAIRVWARGDSLVDRLLFIAAEMHVQASTQAPYKALAGMEFRIKQLDTINVQLTAEEDQFSYSLGEGSRWMESLLLKILFLVAITVISLVLLLTVSMSTRLARGLNDINLSFQKVAAADFTQRAKVISQDEIGRLALSFNQMVEDLQKKIEERDRAVESLQQQKTVYETLVFAQSEMGEGVLIVENERIVFANPAACEMYGYSEMEMKSMPSFLALVAGKEQKRLGQIYAKNAAGEEGASTGETTVVRKDGRVIQIGYSRKIMEVAGGLQIISIVRDISEQKSAEKKIAELAAIVEASDDAIISKSTGGIILNWNHGAEKLYGYKAEEVLGKHVSILALPGQSQEFDSITARVVEGEHIEQYETLRRRKNGSTVPVSLTVSPIRDHAGEVAAISIIGRDISFRKQTENALKEKTDELERSNTELEQFAYIASHDLREPLRTITSYLQLLQQRYAAQLDADGNEFIDFTVDGAKRMDRLIKDLLTYSRLGSANLQFEEVALSDTMEIVLSHLQESAKLQEAKITYDSLPVIVASGLQMVQLFQNLIMNAIKFRGPSPPEIHIGFMERPNDYLFSVTDNGIGIDPKYNKKIFAIFQRLHSREEYDGTGIGLAICKKIVERHKGEIWFEPNPAGGAKFYFTIEKLII